MADLGITMMHAYNNVCWEILGTANWVNDVNHEITMRQMGFDAQTEQAKILAEWEHLTQKDAGSF
jgi:hypothetical protein